MTRRRIPHWLAFLLCLVAACGAAAWHFDATEPVFEARARIRLPGDEKLEEVVRSADGVERIVTAPSGLFKLAAERLKQRSVQLVLSSPLNSEADELANRTSIVSEPQPGQQEIALAYKTSEATDAVPVLTAIVDAYLEAQRKSTANPPPTVPAALQAEKLQFEQAFQQQQATIAVTRQKLAALALDETKRAAAFEKVKSLSGALAETRRLRLEAENRFAQIRKDLDGGLPIELLAARIPDGKARAIVQEALTQAKLQRELKQHAATFLQLSAVYGRNHPRLVELQRQIDDLHSQLAVAGNSPASNNPPSPAALLLQALDGGLNESQASERDIQDQLQAEQAGLEQFTALQKSFEEGTRELARLQGERDRVEKQIAEIQRQQQPKTATVLEPPALAAVPVSPVLWHYYVAGPSAGTLLGLLMIWLLPRRRPVEVPVVNESVKEQDGQDILPMETETPATIQERRLARAARLKAMRLRAA